MARRRHFGRGRQSAVGASACLVVLAVGLAISGCGGDDDGATGSSSAGEAGQGGTLVWALATAATESDPLYADSAAEQLVTRQVHEPLVATMAGPFGDVRRAPGLARRVRSSQGDTLWTLRLREGVRFQDGEPLNSAAVLANARRWQTTSPGLALLSDVFAVDSPRPHQVRFQLDSPDPRFDQRLADPRLGLVSPRALRPRSGEAATLRPVDRTGSGPFELRERSPDRLLAANNLDWWGIERGLGPALDQLEFRVVTDPEARLAMLQDGLAQVGSDFGGRQLRRLRRDPLLVASKGPGEERLGLERSVRGLESASEPPVLSGVWLTTLGPG